MSTHINISNSAVKGLCEASGNGNRRSNLTCETSRLNISSTRRVIYAATLIVSIANIRRTRRVIILISADFFIIVIVLLEYLTPYSFV